MKILPSEFIQNNIDTYLYKHTTHSQKIYWVVLIVLAVALVSLPFIYVDISVQDRGVVRPISEKTELRSGISEFVDSVYVREGSKLRRGDTLLTFRSNNPEYRINYQKNRIDDYEAHLSDLKHLTKGSEPKTFYSNMRKQEYAYFLMQTQELETNLLKATKDLERNKSLFDKHVISVEEYEKYQFEHSRALNELASLKDNQISKWQTEMNAYTNSYHEMLSEMNQQIIEKELYVVTSPVDGTLDHFNGIYKGCNIQTGTSLAIISPDSTLYFEAYVSPRNIGYIFTGMPVNVQIESFNYNEWGTISGLVTDISSDFFTDNNTGEVYYKVKCSMDKDYLIRKNGAKGKLKKGMTVACHFMITKRSLFNLIYQKIDDWINPTQYNEIA